MAVKNNKSPSDKTVGQIFTPSYIAEFMVKNILRVLKDHSNKYDESLKLENLKVLEPSSGQGIFLKILLENDFRDITAYEIDESLKLYLESTYPEINFKFQNFLASNSEEMYDVIIGNPPYLGQNYNSSLFQDLVQKYDVCKKYFVGNMDLFYYFIHQGIEKLKPGGLLSFITTNYWITKSKKTGIKYLKPFIIENCFLLEYYDLSNLNIFKNAQGQHNCIFILQKKTSQQKVDHLDKPIQIYQFRDDQVLDKSLSPQNIISYQSGLNNSGLSKNSSWNLLYPIEIKRTVEKIENLCKRAGKLLTLKDIFLIRNGLILIKDDLFILEKDKNLKLNNEDIFIKIENEYKKINKAEKKRLKRLYKSSSILPYGYNQHKSYQYLIYFNKNDFEGKNASKFIALKKKYPHLTKYLELHELELKETLKNAKEDPQNIYYPRRGGYILIPSKNKTQQKIHLEPFYENFPKIFFPYICDKNIFGFCATSYYATSDTYFLWPKNVNSNIDYNFWLAYLNSKLVTFLFKAKNIRIKRSKTKLEYNLPFPNLTNFQSTEKMRIISLIRNLSVLLTKLNTLGNEFLSEQIRKEMIGLIQNTNLNKFISNNFTFEQKIDSIFIKKIINTLFFRLFNLEEEEIDYLIKKYYYT